MSVKHITITLTLLLLGSLSACSTPDSKKEVDAGSVDPNPSDVTEDTKEDKDISAKDVESSPDTQADTSGNDSGNDSGDDDTQTTPDTNVAEDIEGDS
jgi:hypothetical protein